MPDPTASAHLIDCLRDALAGRYVPERELGRGGMATVILARDVRHDRLVAIKVLHRELAVAVGTERFEREIRTIAGLQHPHILPLHESGEACGSLYYVMPYVSGESLRDRLRREKQLSVDDALHIAREVASALDYAHRRGVVHRDIKPENILLEDGHAVLADFGIARVADALGEQITATGIVVGTPTYMSPEQAGGLGTLDGRSDLYSLACVVYEMLSGEPPFTGVTAQSVIARQLSDTPPPLRTVRPSVSPQVADVISRALEKIPADRYTSITEFLRALAAAPVVPKRSRRSVPYVLLPLAAVVLAGAAVLAVRARAHRAAAAGASPTVVAVLPFVVRGGADVAYLREGMVDLLSTDLDGAGALRSVDPQTLLRALPGGDSAVTDPARAREIAARVGAGRFVLGSVVEAGGRLRVSAALYDSARGSTALAQAGVEGHATEIFSLVDRLAAALLVRQDARLIRLDSLTTSSFPALKAYLEGIAVFRAGRYGEAVTALRRAISDDPSFALAYYRLALAAEWNAQFDLAAVTMRDAMPYRARLAERDRRLFDALLSWQHGRIDDAEREYRAILAAYPDEAEAWLQLGEVLVHYNPQRGRSMTEARGAFERALAVFPASADVVPHLLDIALIERQRTRFDSLYARLDPSTEPAVRRRVMRAFAWGTPADRERAVAELRGARDGSLVFTAGAVGVYLGDLDGAMRVARLMTEPSRAPAVQAGGYALLAHLATGAGRVTQARAMLDQLRRIVPAAAVEHAAFLGVMRGLPHPPEELDSLRRSLAAFRADGVPPVGSTLPWLTMHDAVHVILREYLVGVTALRQGDTITSASAIRALLRPVAGDAAVLAAGLRAGLQSEVEVHRGQLSAALAALARSDSVTAPVVLVASSPFYARTAERFLRAEILRELGRDDEALAWYATLGENRQDVAYLALAHLRRGRLYETRQDPGRAIEHYRRFVAMWHAADRELQPVVQDTRGRLAALGDRPGSP